MCNAFSRNGLKVKLYLEGDDRFFERLSSFERNAFKSKPLFDVSYWTKKHKNKLINRFLIRRKIRQIVELEQADIVITRDPALLKAIIGKKTPMIFESHNAKHHLQFNLIHRYFEGEILRATKAQNFLCLFSISKALSDHWGKLRVDKSKLFSWHDGFDSQLFHNHVERIDARRPLNLPSDKKIATYAGGLYHDREIDNLIRLAGFFPDVIFLLIGGPENNKNLFETLAFQNKISNIFFTGFVNHNLIPQYLFASDVLLALWSSKVPTISYCSPLKLFEYMASGRTILAHGFPTIHEVLKDNEDAVFCEPGNFDSMKKKFEQALSLSDDNELGKNARRKAFEFYTWDIRADRLMSFVEKARM